MPKMYVYDWHWKLKSSPEDLWVYVSDTHRLNLVTGMPKIEFTEVPQLDGTVKRFAHAPIYSWLSLDWEEVPFDWVKPTHHQVKRIFSSRLFPIKSLQNKFNLVRLDDGGTDLQFELTLEANGLIGRWLIPGIAKGVYASFGAAFQQFDEFIQQGKGRPFNIPIVPIEHDGRNRMDSLFAELRRSRHKPELVNQLETHLQASAVEELTRMRPYVFANLWSTDRTETLSLFLHATSLGLLDLSWDILCPECRGAKHHADTLFELPETVHCPSCNIDYQAHFDQSVEATFSLNPDIAITNRTDYCIGGPHATPHVVVQQVLQAGETRTAIFPIKTGDYRLRAPRLGGADVRVPAAILAPIQGQPWVSASLEANSVNMNIAIHDAGIDISTPTVKTGRVAIEMTNLTSIPQTLILEDGNWSRQIATAADVTALQAFRNLFSSEALRPGYMVNIQNMVVLFSDLKDSTAMYQTVGDAAAFGKVIDHFDILREVIFDNHGALVKTIGDSVMAVFRDPANGLRAGLEMLKRIDAFNQTQAGNPIQLKLGLHQGACIAVTLNERLDYFGSTVNIAARLEGQSTGNNIVTTEDLMRDYSVRQLFQSFPVQVEVFTTTLRGFDENQQLYRVSWRHMN